jgi:hypothetical protein
MDDHALYDEFTSGKLARRRLMLIAGLVVLVLFGIGIFMMVAAGSTASKQDAAAAARPVNLKDYYHTPAYSFRNSRFPWGEVPRGKKTFAGVPLDIGGAMYLWGAANAERGSAFVETVEGIDVGRKFDTLYLFHGAFMSAAEGAPVYYLTMHYADGSSSKHTIRFGDHVRDWYEGRTSKTELNDPKSHIVWRVDHPKTTPHRPIKLRFSITPIANPKPSVEVKSIDLTSSKGNANGVILAMTTGPAELLKADEGREPEAKDR